ncbi:MAG: hypothetical protein REI12_09000 [Pedobacter sp.]|nr:hypothetical protein [Pedobacter sp.]
MSRLLQTILLAFSLLATAAYAAEADEQLLGSKKTRIKVENTDDIYVGVGLFSDMLNANLEFVTDEWGYIMVRAGRFHNIGEGFAANASWRRPLTVDDKLGSGYYIGVFGGQVSGDVLEGEIYQRIGGGAEMGYHWVTEYTRAEATIGLGAAMAEKNEQTGKELTAEPTIFFSFNIALGY